MPLIAGVKRLLVLLALAASLQPSGTGASGSLAAGRAGLSASAAQVFVIRIPKVARLRVTGTPAQLAVSAQDIETGYVEVTGIRVDVLTNFPADAFLAARVVAAVAQSVEVAGLPHSLVANPEGQMRLSLGARRGLDGHYELRVIVRLARGLAPGRYPWPLFLAVTAS